jgi:hypothetical protein
VWWVGAGVLHPAVFVYGGGLLEDLSRVWWKGLGDGMTFPERLRHYQFQRNSGAPSLNGKNDVMSDLLDLADGYASVLEDARTVISVLRAHLDDGTETCSVCKEALQRYDERMKTLGFS